MIAIVDAGPLYASSDLNDEDHDRSIAVLAQPHLHLVIPALVIAEVTYLIGRRLGAKAEADFLRGIARFDVEAPSPEDWSRIADLVDRYSNLPLGGTDSSVIALAERIGTDLILTLDRRHFGVVRHRNGAPFQLLP